MTRIKEKFVELEAKKEKALIAYIMAGFPNEKATIATVRGLVKGGVDIIELGFPFSDPLADGPVIQNSSTVSFETGTKIAKFFSLVETISIETEHSINPNDLHQYSIPQRIWKIHFRG